MFRFGIAVALVCFFLAFTAEASQEEGKVVLITGASSGIGYAVAKHLANKGMSVVLTARREDKLQSAVAEIKAAGGKAMYLKLDVTKDQDHIDAFKAAADAYGGIDYIFVNAGFEGPLKPIEQMDMADTQKVIDINVMGMIKTVKYGKPYLVKRGGGAMISVSSIAGTMHRDLYKNVGHDAFLSYAVSKAATDMFARVFSVYEKENIRFYNLKPAVFDSEMARRISPNPSDEHLAAFAAFNPFFVGLPGNPDFIAEAVEHMFTGSTKWQAGQNVVIDNDGTWDAHEWYKSIEVPSNPTPVDLKKTIKSVSGGDYKCSSENTCKWYNGEAGPLAPKKDEL